MFYCPNNSFIYVYFDTRREGGFYRLSVISELNGVQHLDSFLIDTPLGSGVIASRTLNVSNRFLISISIDFVGSSIGSSYICGEISLLINSSSFPDRQFRLSNFSLVGSQGFTFNPEFPVDVFNYDFPNHISALGSVAPGVNYSQLNVTNTCLKVHTFYFRLATSPTVADRFISVYGTSGASNNTFRIMCPTPVQASTTVDVYCSLGSETVAPAGCPIFVLGLPSFFWVKDALFATDILNIQPGDQLSLGYITSSRVYFEL